MLCLVYQTRNVLAQIIMNVPEVGSLKTRRSSSCNMERILEMLVQGIKKTVTEAPQEEKRSYKSKRIDGLTKCDLRSLRALVIARL